MTREYGDPWILLSKIHNFGGRHHLEHLYVISDALPHRICAHDVVIESKHYLNLHLHRLRRMLRGYPCYMISVSFTARWNRWLRCVIDGSEVTADTMSKHGSAPISMP